MNWRDINVKEILDANAILSTHLTFPDKIQLRKTLLCQKWLCSLYHRLCFELDGWLTTSVSDRVWKDVDATEERSIFSDYLLTIYTITILFNICRIEIDTRIKTSTLTRHTINIKYRLSRCHSHDTYHSHQPYIGYINSLKTLKTNLAIE